MSTTTAVIAATTAAVSNQTPYDAGPHSEVSFLAYGLAGAETITPYVATSGGWVQLYDSSGTAITMTATKPQLVLPGGPRYGFTKSATAGAAGLDAAPGLRA